MTSNGIHNRGEPLMIRLAQSRQFFRHQNLLRRNLEERIHRDCFSVRHFAKGRKKSDPSVPRAPTKKQRRKYARKQAEISPHGQPNSKSPGRKEHYQSLLDDALNPTHELEDPIRDYTINDAVLDDMMGNTSNYTPSPTPKYMGNMYRACLTNVRQGARTDRDISLLVRSYRDAHGRRQKPVGLVAVLRLLLQDLQLKPGDFGDLTYTALLTACATPAEGRRIHALQQEYGVPLTEYHWSALVDLYCKQDDALGALACLDEMPAPTLPATTSTVAACARVVRQGSRFSQEIRKQVAEKGWELWQEWQIHSPEGATDAMLYGAIISLCSARGQAERCINLLEEMTSTFDVPPTTYCYTMALRGIAKSHKIALRFEHGSSKRYARRQYLASHHGKMAINVVEMLENADAPIDDGFVAALMECSATAGDLATVKAIAVAMEVRSLDELRPIGSNEHLKELRGENQLAVAGDTSSLTEHESFGLREYGKDSRVYKQMLHACSTASDKQGMGTIWQGRENEGYLCENSLRLINARRLPQFSDPNIPGATVTDNLTWDGENEFQKNYHKDIKSRRGQWKGVRGDDSASTIDELSEDFSRMFVDPKTGRRKEEFRKLTLDELWKLKYGDEEEEERLLALEEAKRKAEETPTTNLFFNSDTMKWETKPFASKSKDDGIDETNIKEETDNPKTSPSTPEIYFDMDTMKWKERNPHQHPEALNLEKQTLEGSAALTDFERERLVNRQASKDNDDETFQLFYDELKTEAKLNGEDYVTEVEARELFSIVHEDYDKLMEMNETELEGMTNPENVEAFVSQFDHDLPAAFSDQTLHAPASDSSESMNLEASSSPLTTTTMTLDPDFLTQVSQGMNMELAPGALDDLAPATQQNEFEPAEPEPHLAVLQETLPSFSKARLRRVCDVFDSTLGTPSLLELVPLVRERMPDYITNTWLKQMSNMTAHYVVSKAAEKGLIDTHILNGALEVEASSGSLKRAESFHAQEFTAHGMEPNAFSDRLVLNMFLKNQRLNRAFEFKRKIQLQGRVLDLHSYGSLVDYCAKRGHVGSSLLLLKECIVRHGAPPNEGHLSDLRTLCRAKNMTQKTGLEDLIGEDPVQWLRHGEAHLKRESSKKGRRNTLFTMNRAVAA